MGAESIDRMGVLVGGAPLLGPGQHASEGRGQRELVGVRVLLREVDLMEEEQLAIRRGVLLGCALQQGLGVVQ